MGVAYNVVYVAILAKSETVIEKMTDPADTVIDFTEASTELETGASYNAQNRSVSLPLALLEKI